MTYSKKLITPICALVVVVLAMDTMAEPAAADLHLFAVEIMVGAEWDSSKAPNEQAYFKEHSLNLKRLRDEGHIVMGARYSDKGLVIFSARSIDEVTAMMEQDPAMAAGTFVYEVFAFSVFYPGLVQAASTQ